MTKLGNNSRIYFEPFHNDYGNAEFAFCVRWRRTSITDVWITRQQQVPPTSIKGRKARHDWGFFHLPVNGASDMMTIGSWTHKGMDEARVWLHFWCKQHSCVGIRVYPPLQAHSLEVHILSNLGLMFDLSTQSKEEGGDTI